jgi:hypothetical protein
MYYRMKERKVLHLNEIQILLDTHICTYNSKYVIWECKILPAPTLRDVLGVSRYTPGPEGGIAPSYKKNIVSKL